MNQFGITTKRRTVKPMAAQAMGKAWIMLCSYRHPNRGLCGGER